MLGPPSAAVLSRLGDLFADLLVNFLVREFGKLCLGDMIGAINPHVAESAMYKDELKASPTLFRLEKYSLDVSNPELGTRCAKVGTPYRNSVRLLFDRPDGAIAERVSLVAGRYALAECALPKAYAREDKSDVV